jgi:diguanylate cyclase
MLGRGISNESLRQLSKAGIWVTIDHFGSAITSLSVLRRSRANALKLDAEGIAELKPMGSELMSAMIAACQSFGVLVAADGAHTRDDFDWLVRLGVNQVQGAYVGTTVTAEEMQVLIATHEAIALQR